MDQQTGSRSFEDMAIGDKIVIKKDCGGKHKGYHSGSPAINSSIVISKNTLGKWIGRRSGSGVTQCGDIDQELIDYLGMGGGPDCLYAGYDNRATWGSYSEPDGFPPPIINHPGTIWEMRDPDTFEILRTLHMSWWNKPDSWNPPEGTTDTLYLYDNVQYIECVNNYYPWATTAEYSVGDEIGVYTKGFCSNIISYEEYGVNQEVACWYEEIIPGFLVLKCAELTPQKYYGIMDLSGGSVLGTYRASTYMNSDISLVSDSHDLYVGKAGTIKRWNIDTPPLYGNLSFDTVDLLSPYGYYTTQVLPIAEGPYGDVAVPYGDHSPLCLLENSLLYGMVFKYGIDQPTAGQRLTRNLHATALY
jgi:hypothetical protein